MTGIMKYVVATADNVKEIPVVPYEDNVDSIAAADDDDMIRFMIVGVSVEPNYPGECIADVLESMAKAIRETTKEVDTDWPDGMLVMVNEEYAVGNLRIRRGK